MKLTSIEKSILGIMIFLILILGFSIHSCNKIFEEKGGFSQIIIDTGREFKSIKKEIDK